MLLAWGLLAGHPLWHATVDAAPIALCAVVASRPRVSRRNRAVAVCVGLVTSSAVVVHLMNGAVEGHFHFFVMVSVLALYEDWFPYLLAFAFVLGHHGLMGVLEPAAVFNHPDAIAHPWRWAGIHALFIAALGLVNVVHWRLNEDARADALHTRESFRHAFDDAPISMALTGLDGVVVRANVALCERLGADPAGRPLAELVDAEDLGGRPFPADGGEIEVRYADTGAWGLWHHSRLTGRDGRPEAWISHCIDVSKRRFAEDERPGRRTTTRSRACPTASSSSSASAARWAPRGRSPCCSSTSTTSRSSTTRSATAPVIASSAAWPSACAACCARATSSPERAQRARSPRAAARRRRGDVPRQGDGQVALRGLRRLDARERDGAPGARERPAPRARRRRAAPRLPAARHARRRPPQRVSLGLQAVAEGVETAEQLAMLRAFSCQTGQGYHFARPAGPDAIAKMLSAAPAAQRRAV